MASPRVRPRCLWSCMAVLIVASCGGADTLGDAAPTAEAMSPSTDAQGRPDGAPAAEVSSPLDDTGARLDGTADVPAPEAAQDAALPEVGAEAATPDVRGETAIEPTIDAPSEVLAADVMLAPDRPGDAAADVAPGASDAMADTALEAAPADPVCSTADQSGFFSSCSTCKVPSDCDAISVGGRTRYACGCGGGCACGFRCGCYNITAQIRVCNICVR